MPGVWWEEHWPSSLGFRSWLLWRHDSGDRCLESPPNHVWPHAVCAAAVRVRGAHLWRVVHLSVEDCHICRSHISGGVIWPKFEQTAWSNNIGPLFQKAELRVNKHVDSRSRSTTWDLLFDQAFVTFFSLTGLFWNVFRSSAIRESDWCCFKKLSIHL